MNCDQPSSPYREIFLSWIDKCKTVFKEKMAQYGISWRAMRLTTITDLILIKAARIRQIEEKGTQYIPDTPQEEWMGVVNYSIVAIMRLRNALSIFKEDLIMQVYDDVAKEACELFLKKDTDYGSIWREMSPTSYTDIVISRVYRIKNILQHARNSEKNRSIIEENLFDIINYGIIALMRSSPGEIFN